MIVLLAVCTAEGRFVSPKQLYGACGNEEELLLEIDTSYSAQVFARIAIDTASTRVGAIWSPTALQQSSCKPVALNASLEAKLTGTSLSTLMTSMEVKSLF